MKIVRENISFERGGLNNREEILDRVLDRKITLLLDAADVITDTTGKIDKTHEYNEFFLGVIKKSGAEWRQVGDPNYRGVPIEFRGTKEQLLPIIGMWDAHQREPEELEAALKDWDGNETDLWDVIG